MIGVILLYLYIYKKNLGDLQARELALSTLQNRFNIKKEYEKLDTELNELKLFSAFNAE